MAHARSKEGGEPKGMRLSGGPERRVGESIMDGLSAGVTPSKKESIRARGFGCAVEAG